MIFSNVLRLFGGLALFLYGINLMGEGLSLLGGGRMERFLGKVTGSKARSVLVGAGVTAVVQSSSAVTVMVVGLVDAGILKLQQAVGIIMGANIGTTATSWLVGLAGTKSHSGFLHLAEPISLAALFAAVGMLLFFGSRATVRKASVSKPFVSKLSTSKVSVDKGLALHSISTIVIGFAILMFGMEAMSSAVAPLADVPRFGGLLTRFSNPFLGLLSGAAVTTVLQSSSASVGMLQVLCATGSLSCKAAIPIILGQNIGTCATTLLAGAGAGKNARCAAFVHLYFNVVGAGLFLGGFGIMQKVCRMDVLARPIDGVGIAVIHSVFNVVTTLVLLPFSRHLVWLASYTVKGTAICKLKPKRRSEWLHM